MRSIRRAVVGAVIMLTVGRTAWSQTIYPTATVTVSGAQSGTPTSGTMTIAFNNHSHTVSYGPYSTASSIASAVAAAFASYPASAWPRLCTIGVCAKANGAAITFQLKSSALVQPIVITWNATNGVVPFQATASGWTQITPLISWTTPTAIDYGTALSATQLNATANVPGMFTYSPPAGTVLGVGSPTLTTTFTPTDLINYVTASATVSILVTSAQPTITMINPPRSPVGATISIIGANFGTNPGTVTIDGIVALNVFWFSNSIAITIPSGAKAGVLSLTTSNGSTVNGSLVIVQPLQSCPI